MALAVALESLDINRPAVCQECGRRKSSYALYSSDSDSDSGSVPGIIDSDSDSVPGVVDTDSEEEAGPPRAAGARVRPLASQVEPWTEAEDAFLRSLVPVAPLLNWIAVANELKSHSPPGVRRSAKQCRDRVKCHLDPKAALEREERRQRWLQLRTVRRVPE